MLTLTDMGRRAEIAKFHEARALAEFQSCDRKYARAAHRLGVRTLRVVREICAARMERKHRRTVPDVHPVAVTRWCNAVAELWKILVPNTAAGERGNAPDSCMAFIVGCLYGMAEGVTHAKTNCRLLAPDPELAAALPPPLDLPLLGVQQRTRSSGQKQLHRLMNTYVQSVGGPEKAKSELERRMKIGEKI